MTSIELPALGQRICIIGPSNSGKSSLAEAVGRKLGIDVIHLDRLRHRPNTDWELRPDGEFKALHDAAILAEAWVMDGNYSSHFSARFARATGIIYLRGGPWGNFLRYLRRTLFQRERAGTLEGGRDSLKLEMVTWVLLQSDRDRERNTLMVEATGLPVVHLATMRAVNAAYRAWGLLPEPHPPSRPNRS
jgi:adenylate kinase family enzyme